MTNNNENIQSRKYLALCCKTIIFSKYIGHCCFCFCGDAYVDELGYDLVRLGGNVELIEETPVIGEDLED